MQDIKKIKIKSAKPYLMVYILFFSAICYVHLKKTQFKF